jgi:hypothetical protein
MKGTVYCLYSENCPTLYIGSTTQYYLSQRLAGHAQTHKLGLKDYHGLFCETHRAKIKVLEEINFNEKHELLTCERKWIDQYLITDKENLVNIRRVGLTPEEILMSKKKCMIKYHNSPAGKLSLEKSSVNTQIKKLKKLLEDKDDQITNLDETIKEWKCAYKEEINLSQIMENKLKCEINDHKSKMKILEKRLENIIEKQVDIKSLKSIN